MKQALLSLFFLVSLNSYSQAELSSWMMNTTGETGYNNLPSNVQSVDYTSTDVYISCSCIPGYDIGPWAGNPNQAENQNYCYKITRNPQEAINHQATGLGHIGVWSNGVSVFNAKDAFSYNNQGVWNQDAFVFEGASFDECLGHPAPNGEYHNHINPTCLYDDMDDQNHSPIIGYAFDGFPIYGAYAYTNADGTGAIKRMESGYQLRGITERNSLADGTQLNTNQYGPTIGGQYPLGSFLEDYEHSDAYGDLDEHNGRFCITPDYPNGIYAYFVTIDENAAAIYPYTIGITYYGQVQSGNTGPQSGHNTIPANALSYGLSVDNYSDGHHLQIYPNPAAEELMISYAENGFIELYSACGSLVYQQEHNNKLSLINVQSLSGGIYFLRIYLNGGVITRRIIRE